MTSDHEEAVDHDDDSLSSLEDSFDDSYSEDDTGANPRVITSSQINGQVSKTLCKGHWSKEEVCQF